MILGILEEGEEFGLERHRAKVCRGGRGTVYQCQEVNAGELVVLHWKVYLFANHGGLSVVVVKPRWIDRRGRRTMAKDDKHSSWKSSTNLAGQKTGPFWRASCFYATIVTWLCVDEMSWREERDYFVRPSRDL